MSVIDFTSIDMIKERVRNIKNIIYRNDSNHSQNASKYSITNSILHEQKSGFIFGKALENKWNVSTL